MDDYYHHFLTSMSGVGGHPAGKTDELSSTSLPKHSIPEPGSTMQDSYQYLQNLGAFPNQPNLHISNAAKARKKSMTAPAYGVEHVKHRRTRSGCFMCRSRRIKCDEARPICERCKKGTRDCVYPDPPTSRCSKLKDGRSSPQRTSTKSSNDGENGDDEQDMKSVDRALDEDEGAESSPEMISDSQMSECWTGCSSTQDLSAESVSQIGNMKIRHCTSNSHRSKATPSSDLSVPTGRHADWSHLPPDYQHYLNYFVENITSFHYSISHDEENFFGTILPSLAVHHEPLLNAVVGFSAYHSTLKNPNGKLQEFLKYYNRSVTLLLETIKTKTMDNVLTLEYFGDWINLMGHQKAAFQVIRKIFDPQSILKTAIGRACLDWYTRYDCFVALMGGFPTDLPKEWFQSLNEYHKSRVMASPNDLNCQISLRSTELRAISYDMSMLYARGSRGQIDPEAFAHEHSKITAKLLEWKSTWRTALSVPEYLVTDFSYRTMADPDDIVDPYVPGLLYKGPLFTNTLISTEWQSIMIMHLSQSSDTPAEQVFVEMAKHAYTICQYFETVEFWPLKPKGALIPLQCCVSLACLFLPRDSRHQMWARRKLALMDTMGFIYPTAQRMKLAQLFRDPSCARWWLPDDEGLTPVLQAIRAYADERNTAAVNAQHENIREVRHLFAKLEAAEMFLKQTDRSGS
ncbi:hypothetical protein E4U41_006371 [Claviceps citrina]|nr:hypothetical protein E4U41_006371 [Claviceps citrina]